MPLGLVCTKRFRLIKTSREFNSAHVWPKGCVLRKTAVFSLSDPGIWKCCQQAQEKDSRIVINCSDASELIGIDKTGSRWRATRDNLSPRRKGCFQPFRPTSPSGETCHKSAGQRIWRTALPSPRRGSPHGRGLSSGKYGFFGAFHRPYHAFGRHSVAFHRHCRVSAEMAEKPVIRSSQITTGPSAQWPEGDEYERI
ncbi:hypothetical protein EDC59_101405 [Pseudodesulfovibrio indicus]|uniref:Uncharacterized protein n=1 Tax=Pseudodesulfovibrio indicus TaxID=1716143 RepID=A0AA94TLX9_9BACT|nr:hypothetical protein EDC59_101405 [Pseudodesulfovibrio indicus]